MDDGNSGEKTNRSGRDSLTAPWLAIGFPEAHSLVLDDQRQAGEYGEHRPDVAAQCTATLISRQHNKFTHASGNETGSDYPAHHCLE